jgi:hypothetical protein
VIPNPRLAVFITMKLVNGFYYDSDSWIAVRIYMGRTFFIGINHQVEIITNRNEVVHPFNVFIGIKLGFYYVKTAR